MAEICETLDLNLDGVPMPLEDVEANFPNALVAGAFLAFTVGDPAVNLTAEVKTPYDPVTGEIEVCYDDGDLPDGVSALADSAKCPRDCWPPAPVVVNLVRDDNGDIQAEDADGNALGTPADGNESVHFESAEDYVADTVPGDAPAGDFTDQSIIIETADGWEVNAEWDGSAWVYESACYCTPDEAQIIDGSGLGPGDDPQTLVDGDTPGPQNVTDGNPGPTAGYTTYDVLPDGTIIKRGCKPGSTIQLTFADVDADGDDELTEAEVQAYMDATYPWLAEGTIVDIEGDDGPDNWTYTIDIDGVWEESQNPGGSLEVELCMECNGEEIEANDYSSISDVRLEDGKLKVVAKELPIHSAVKTTASLLPTVGAALDALWDTVIFDMSATLPNPSDCNEQHVDIHNRFGNWTFGFAEGAGIQDWGVRTLALCAGNPQVRKRHCDSCDGAPGPRNHIVFPPARDNNKKDIPPGGSLTENIKIGWGDSQGAIQGVVTDYIYISAATNLLSSFRIEISMCGVTCPAVA